MNDNSQDFSKKMVIVVRKDLEGWQIANTIAHVSAYLGNKMDKSFSTGDDFITKDEIKHPRNAQYAFIIKRAKSNEQLKNLMQKVREADVLYHGFIREMIETTDDEEIQKILSDKTDDEIEYLGIGVFGDNDEVNQLTKKFGLLE